MGNRPYVLGIDPGLSGAWALYDPALKFCISVASLPTKPTPNGKKDEIDISSFCYILEGVASKIAYAIIEDVHAFTGQGVTSMFRFGEALGLVKGAITSYMIPIYQVKPAVWKTQMRLDRDKTKSRKLAQKLFPAIADSFSKASDDGKAEAILLAVFGSLYCDKIHQNSLISN